MRIPCCSICHTRYNDETRVPLLLQCGHGFCKPCLSQMFSSSPDTTLSCPRCRHLTAVGNSVQSLRKNFAILSLVHSKDSSSSSSGQDCDFTEDEDADYDIHEDDEQNESFIRRRSSSRRNLSSSSCGNGAGSAIALSSHTDIRLGRQIGGGSNSCNGVWEAFLGMGSGRCRHRVAVKKVCIGDGADVEWVQNQLENLRRASMWCRNVCTFHGTLKVEGSLCLVMDRCYGSLQLEMRRNKGRFTLEQILRYGADIARGVAELHAAGIACMNLKPSNLLLDANGRVLVSDYGLPAILKNSVCPKAGPENCNSRNHSCIDCTMLSPHYAAPEAWEPAKKPLNIFWDDTIGISSELDAWSFGCTLVEMCTGSIPWAGLSSEEIYKAVVKSKKLPPQYASILGVGIPRELWKMIGECLQFKPSKRPSFISMLAAFHRHLQEIPCSPPATPDSCTKIAEQSSESLLEVGTDNAKHIHKFVSECDVTAVSDMLSRAASGRCSYSLSFLLEIQNADGLTALHLACRRGCKPLVEVILEYEEANVNILDKDGDPPIVFALAAGSPECVRSLIKNGANVKSRLRDGIGPSVTHVCAFHGQPDCMRELLLAGADPNVVDDEGESVLHRVVSKNYTDCAVVILENGGCLSMALPNSKNLTPLHLCIATWNVAVIRRWLEVSLEETVRAVDVPGPLGSALCMAATLKKGHEIEGRELVKLLLAAGADPTIQDPQQGRTVLHMAAVGNDPGLVKIILDAGVDINIRDIHNTTPLHVALARGAGSCVDLLLSSGANCNLQDDEGDSAFHIAADSAKMIRENLDWIIVMLEYHNVDVDLRNHSGKTLCDLIEALPRQWISEDLDQALESKGVHLSPTIYEVGDWVKFRRSVVSPVYGWQGAKHQSVGFVQSGQDREHITVSFCSGEARVLAHEIIKVIPLDRGQHVQLKPNIKEPRFGWREQSRDSVGTVLCVDDDGILRVGFPGASRGWKADPAEMQRVDEFKVGDWVRIRPSLTTVKHGLGSVTPGSIGIVYCIRPDGSMLLELTYLPSPWHCEPEEVEPVTPFKIGDRVCVKRSVAEPRYAWGGETHHSVGKISEIENDGLLLVGISNRLIPWQADPSDMEKLEDFKVGDWVKVKASVPSPKYGWENITRNSIGVIHSLEEDGDTGVAFCFRTKLFSCSITDVELVTPFHVGQQICVMPSVSQPCLGWSDETPATVGKIVRIDMDGTLNVRVVGRSSLWRVSPGDAEGLSGLEVGDWVRSKSSGTYEWTGVVKESVSVVRSIQDNGCIELTSCHRGRWIIHFTEVEKVVRLKPGDRVGFKNGITEPRWGWRGATPDSHGVVVGVNGDGELRVAFPGVPTFWRGDPADLEKEDGFEVGEWVRVGDGRVGVVHGWDGEKMVVSLCGEKERWEGGRRGVERVKRVVVGEKVRVKEGVEQPRFGWGGRSRGSVGRVVGVEGDGRVRVWTERGGRGWAVDPGEVEVVGEERVGVVGEWVRVKGEVERPVHEWGEVGRESVGVVQRVGERGELWVAFCFMERLWECEEWEVERVRRFEVGDRVGVREGVVTPRMGWGMETHASTGVVVGVDANAQLRIRFPWREGAPWLADPADILLLTS